MSNIHARIGGARAALAFKAPCLAATTANITLSGEQTIDGVDVTDGDRVLVKDQTNAILNGIYVCRATAWERAKDFDGADDVTTGTLVYVPGSSSQSGLWEISTATPFVIGTDEIAFGLALGTTNSPHAPVDMTMVPKTAWIEMDGFQPGIISRETSAGTISFNSTYLREKLTAMYNAGIRRFILLSITDSGRTYTRWSTPPSNPSGTTYGWWRDDVASAIQPNVEDFDVVSEILSICSDLDGCRVVVGIGKHDDGELLNDLYTVNVALGADPNRFSKSVTTRLSDEIARYVSDGAEIYARQGGRAAWGGFYISHEPDHIGASTGFIGSVAAALRRYGDIHVSPSTPIDLADSNAIADYLIAWGVDWIWPQTSALYGYNWNTGALSYVSQLTIQGTAEHYGFWRKLVDRALLRTSGAYAPNLGGHVENVRIGTQGAGTLTFGATTGTGITVTLGTTSSIVAADIGKTINVRADQLTGTATVVSITDTTHVVVNITENLADVNIASGFWALVPISTDAIYDPYPALASEVLFELKAGAPFVDEYSLMGEAYWDPGTLSLRLTQSQCNLTDYRTRAALGWQTHLRNIRAVHRKSRQLGYMETWALFATSAAQVSHAGDTTETALATIRIPRGRIGPSGQIRISPTFSNSNNGNNKTFRVRLGAVGAGTGGTAFFASTVTATDVARYVVLIANTSGAAQKGWVSSNGGFGAIAGALATGAIDTENQETEIAISVENANSGDTSSLEYYLIEIAYGA